MHRLDDTVAIVTGGGRGIGRAIARAYAHAGARVVVTAARSVDDLRSLEVELGPERVLGVQADITDQGACERLAADTLARFGRIDTLVNNAARGMAAISPTFMTDPPGFWEVDPAAWRLLVDTDINGHFYVSRAVVPHMIAARHGAIINIGVNYRTIKRRGFSPYGAAKAALEALTIIWAQDLAPHGVTVNLLTTGGPTATSALDGIPLAEEVGAALLQPEVIAEPAIFLASGAARHLTGRRLVATLWSADAPNGYAVADGIGIPGLP